VQAWTTLRHAGFFTTVEATASSRVSANDAATIYAPGFATWNWKVGFAPRASRHFALEPVVGLDNVFDRHFATSVIVNATRSRYFEPGLTRRLYVALRTQAR
jgi:iron complex outermembrane receptor protein